MTKARYLYRRCLLMRAGAAAIALACGSGWTRAQPAPSVVFICEHGYAKSLVAVLHFERLARARGLAVHAMAPGLDPGALVPDAIEAGLHADGFDVGGFVPSRAASQEITDADVVVSIGVDADLSARSGPVVRWDAIPPLPENYDRARREIVALADALLERIASGELHSWSNGNPRG